VKPYDSGMPTFRTRLLATGGKNVGIEIPDEVVTALGGVRVPVIVTIDGRYTYPSTTAVMAGLCLVGVNAAHRKAAEVTAGDEVEITLERDTSPRTVDVPADLAAALAADPSAAAAWEELAPSHRKEHVRAITEAKREETRARRLAACLEALR
jgi:hypothetical protein